VGRAAPPRSAKAKAAIQNPAAIAAESRAKRQYVSARTEAIACCARSSGRPCTLPSRTQVSVRR